MNQLEALLEQLHAEPENIQFQDVVDIIDQHYQYTPTRFINGPKEKAIINAAGENEGSCKIFSFAQINDLTVEQTLNCFGKYYRDDVLKHPDGSDHQNIRTFIVHGWDGIVFDGIALKIIEA